MHRPALGAQPLREHREVEHQRRVGETQTREVDPQVAGRVQRRGQGSAAQAARRPVLIPRDQQDDLL